MTVFKFGKAVFAVLCAAVLLFGCSKANKPEKLYVYAAASTKDAIAELINEFKAETKSTSEFSCVFESSGKIAKQIQEGADANIFISASKKWMEELQKSELIEPNTEFTFAKNSLVVVASEKATSAIAKPEDIPAALGAGKLAVGDPKPVPAGKYAETALTKYGLYESLNAAKKLAFYENVRKVLNAVEMNQADYGIVYNSDAAASAKVKVVYTFSEEDSGAIVYPAAIVKGKATAETKAFVDFLAKAKAQDIIKNKYKFQ